ncbi:MAG: hypothetical protein ING19_02665 [Azospirillum sp.]|nr:hypothetical protein [Azospirillum sp.]
MTVVKPRHPVSFPGAVTRIMGALGLGAAQAIGKSDSLIRKFADPDHDAQPNLDQALALDAAFVLATGDEAPILRVYLQKLEDLTRGAAHVALAPHARLMRVMAEMGEIAGDLHAASVDGQVTPSERAKLQKDIADTIEQLTAMSRDLDVLGRRGGRS